MNPCRILAAALLAALLPAAAAADEADILRLFAEKRCIGCHDTDEMLLGPPYRAVASRHRGADSDMIVEVMAWKIIAGGAGNWGVVPMVRNEHVTIDEARAMSRWILSLGSPDQVSE
ncbi:MAG: cytochrome C [Gammaproteobacteria bacterium]|nr:cytochrome C [Gammaproteobacteria bacterium]